MGRRKVTVILYPSDEGGYVAFMPLLRNLAGGTQWVKAPPPL